MARPTKYNVAFVEQAQKLCELGATDAGLADFFGVSERTIYRWQVEHDEFCQSLKVGKEAADERVQRSLYHRAVGFRCTTQQAIKVKTGQYTEQIEVVDIEVAVPPDTTAGIFWLKNRRPEQWREKVAVEHSGEVTQKHEHVRDEIARELDKHAAERETGSVARVVN